MRLRPSILLAFAGLVASGHRVEAHIELGAAGGFAVLGGSAVTNAGLTQIDGGDVGVGPGLSITGLSPASVAAPFTIRADDAVAVQAHADLVSAYNQAAGLTPIADLSGQDLGGLTLLPGVYAFQSSAQLTGFLTLDDGGDPNAEFVFQIGTTLMTSTNSAVVTIRGGQTAGSGVFWQVGTSATLEAGTAFEGHILAQTSITLNSGATLRDGSALAITGAVTLDTNTIINSVRAVPEPASASLLVFAGAILGLTAVARRSGRSRQQTGA